MATDRPPVIRRDWRQADSDAEVLHVVQEDTSFHRGLGESGRKVEHVRAGSDTGSFNGCPCCGHELMVRLVQVSPVDRDGVEYWCLMPNCRYFVADELSWATKPHPQYVPETPMVWEQTHECESCGNRWSESVTKSEYACLRVENGVVTTVDCDECRSENEVRPA